MAAYSPASPSVFLLQDHFVAVSSFCLSASRSIFVVYKGSHCPLPLLSLMLTHPHQRKAAGGANGELFVCPNLFVRRLRMNNPNFALSDKTLLA